MKTSAAIIALAAATASAQISSIPQCALAPTTEAIGQSGCALTDIKCVCSNTSFLASLAPAIAKACSAEDQAKAVTAAQGLCAQAGVTIPTSAAMVPSSTAATSMMTSSSAAAAPAPYSTGSMPKPASNGTAPVAGGNSTSGTGSSTGTSPSAAATYTGAAARFQWTVGAVAVAGGAALAFA